MINSCSTIYTCFSLISYPVFDYMIFHSKKSFDHADRQHKICKKKSSKILPALEIFFSDLISRRLILTNNVCKISLTHGCIFAFCRKNKMCRDKKHFALGAAVVNCLWLIMNGQLPKPFFRTFAIERVAYLIFEWLNESFWLTAPLGIIFYVMVKWQTVCMHFAQTITNSSLSQKKKTSH